MAIKVSKSPYGYRNLLVYKKAEELQGASAELTRQFPKTKTLVALGDQMDRSARSVKQNIVEGWKRNLTYEYYQFLGYAVASNAELEEDCNDIIRGVYNEMGVRGEKGVMGDVEKLPFFPLDTKLPPVVQLKLRAKELNFLLERLQKSLVDKMAKTGTLSERDKLKRAEERKRKRLEFDIKNFEFIRERDPVTFEKHFKDEYERLKRKVNQNHK